MPDRRPPLWRLARILRLIGTVVLVAIVLFVATAVYFAAQARPSVPGGGGGHAQWDAANSTVELSTEFNISNPGAYPIASVHLAAEVRMPDGSLLARGGSPTVAVPAGSTGGVPVQLWIPVSGSSALLLTHPAQLSREIWANATYASLFSIHFHQLANYSWGAPFYQFNATPGTPVLQSNGTVAVPVTVSWQDQATFGEAGTLAVAVQTASGEACSQSIVPVDVAPGALADLALEFYASAGCDPSGGSVLATFTGMGLSYAFPPEAIP